tara:strand:+ start:708 stop:842 length:135 start_codon:yes stop_codon:yes gene_type:complete
MSKTKEWLYELQEIEAQEFDVDSEYENFTINELEENFNKENNYE